MPTVKKKQLALNVLALCSVLVVTACGGSGDDEDTNANANSPYVSFSGNSNGESVVDANNKYAKFRKTTRLMEVDGVVSDVLVDGNNNLVRGGNQNIGTVQLVGSSSGKAIAGMVATDGTMLAVENKSGGGLTLGKSSVVPADPNSGGSTGGAGGSGNSGGSNGINACGSLKYPGDTSDPQTYSNDSLAQRYQCLYRATKDSVYITRGNYACRLLHGLLSATTGKFTPMFCNGPLLIP